MAKLSTLHIALLASASVHLGLAAMRIAAPEQFNRIFSETPLEVVLVNARTDQAPEKAQVLAQANLTGGGDSAEHLRASSMMAPAPVNETGTDIDTQAAHIAQLKAIQQDILTQLRNDIAKLPLPDPDRDRGDANARALEERRRQMVDLLAVIEKRINGENARPRKRYVSPATREVAYAQYYDTLRRRVEARGTRDFPTQNGRKLYGELTMNISVDHLGRIAEAKVVRGSGNALLDKRAVSIVQACAPFEVFTPEMRKQAEILVITSRFRFTREDGLETSMSSSR
ncbi:energy transducer TonB [Roseateles sp. BYS180W]|uniref:Energy transducer TonB n=1 Tax=Roseateles rivi TaxID=3299028 RepID=A0ABW7FW86_9BURK